MYRFTLRGILVFVAIAGAGLAALAQLHRSNHYEAKIADSLKSKYRGAVVFRDTFDHREIENDPLRKFFNRRRAIKVCFTADGMTDNEFAAICKFGDLEQLTLSRSSLTSVGVARIKRLKKLRRMSLSKAPIDDDCVGHIVKLTNLERLFLTATDITDDCIAHLSTLTNLKSLGIRSTLISPEGAERLKKALPNCDVDYMRRTADYQRKL